MLPVWATEKTAAPEVIVTVVDDPPDGVIDVGLGEGAWGEEETQSPRRQRHGHVEYYSKI